MSRKPDDWHAIAFDLYEGVVRGRHAWRRKAYAAFREFEVLGAEGGDVAAALLEAAGGRMAPSLAGTRPVVEGLMLPLKMVRYGLALEKGNWSAVAPHERDAVAEALRADHADVVATRPPDVAPRLDVSGAAHVTLPFAHAWRRRGEPVPLRGEGQVTLEVLDPSDAPVAVSLRTPDGSDLDVRRRGDLWFRPVLEPGSWRPATLGAFARAAASGEPWADNPFLAEMRPDGVVSPLDLYAAPAGAPLRGDAASAAKAAASCLGAAGPLFVVDGVVHRSVPEPVVEVGRLVRPGKVEPPRMGDAWTVAWRCGDLHSDRSMTTDRVDLVGVAFGDDEDLRFGRCDPTLVGEVLARWLEIHFGQRWRRDDVDDDVVRWSEPDGDDASALLSRAVAMARRDGFGGPLAAALARAGDVLADPSASRGATIEALEGIVEGVGAMGPTVANHDARRALCAALAQVGAGAVLARMRAEPAQDDDLGDFVP